MPHKRECPPTVSSERSHFPVGHAEPRCGQQTHASPRKRNLTPGSSFGFAKALNLPEPQTGLGKGGGIPAALAYEVIAVTARVGGHLAGGPDTEVCVCVGGGRGSFFLFPRCPSSNGMN